jgi:DNA-binding MarR family transcriptional regulator
MKERFRDFTVLIALASRCVRKIKTEEMAEFNLKSPHVSCLYYLSKQETLTAKELCDICHEDKAAISRSLDYLEKNGYISCASEAKKRYKSPLSLTEKGQTAGKNIAKKIDGILQVAGDGLTEENRAVFYQSLELICKNLQTICEKYNR